MPEVFELRLVVEKHDTGYRARWVESGGQPSSPCELVLPASTDDVSELRWYLEQFHGSIKPGVQARAQEVERRLEFWGHRLFGACFGGSEGTHVYRNLLAATDARRPVLLTLGSIDRAFLEQPWEMMRDHRGPLAFQGVSIRRQLIGARPARRLRFELPLRVLLIVARPKGLPALDPRISEAPLRAGLATLSAGVVDVQLCEPATLAQLEERISAARRARKPFHIVHYDGDGEHEPDGDEVGVLAFERDDRSLDLVDGRRLGDLLGRLDIPLVVLEACRSSGFSAAASIFASVAPTLLESGVGSVVAFSHRVNVVTSRLLITRFYRELAAGLSVGEALSEARVALRATRERWPPPAVGGLEDWFIPQLYQVGADPVLIRPRRRPRGRAADPRCPGFE